ncbi:MAG: response regulator [Ignavibacteriaceae bacterium]
MLLFPIVLAVVDTSIKKKILVIEDNIESQLIFKIYLRDLYDVEITGNAEKGFDLLEKNNYDLLVLDINLPGKFNGEDIIKNLKAKGIIKAPIIVITAYGLKGDKEKYIEMGANDFLTKPVEKTTLLEKVNKILNSKN